ncbi:hypothetical protein [Cellulomonas sp. S1-8]|uniref:hypothetical protein n=1 Tax=Cellulomonas sp. S1-8 TaxID=2904790 RepID=UPI0022435F5F|nr:hypothetical protein [Cellulomonas sp. S1-8]UZN03310.1 hypothetical protein OKX07_20045 [Cellulomonas sp. S1-8]
MTPRTSTTGSSRRTAALGVVAVTFTVGVAGVGCASASADRPAAGVTAGDAAPPAPGDDAVPTTDAPPVADGLAGADEYTQERSDAFWGAGYYMEDAFVLAELWDVPLLEAKGRAGQLLLDEQPVPVAPGSSLDLTDPETIEMLGMEKYWDGGYTHEDGASLAALWDMDVYEAKATAGRMLYDGQPLPIPPSGTPES